MAMADRPRPTLPTSLAALLALTVGCGPTSNAAGEAELQVVRRGPLTITIRERGELHASQDTRVSSELEGRNTLIYLIEEGTTVEQGEKLAELDASEIEEKRSSEAIAVARARAALEQARKNVEIVEKELAAAEKTAENRVKIAHMREEKLLGQPQAEGTNGSAAPADRPAPGTNAEMLAKLSELVVRESRDHADVAARHHGLADDARALFGADGNVSLQMGEMANQILENINEISLARSDLELASETLHYSRKLHEKGFLTKNELDRHELDFERGLSQITLAWNNLDLLVNYTLPESLIEARQEVENAELELESVKATSEARRVREAAELASSEAEYELAEQRLANWTDQIEKSILYAPNPGLVVYGRWDWDEPVYEGMEVRQRQEIVILPDIRNMIAELKVHEAQIDKAAVGQVATVHVDAFPEMTFGARVTEVATLPDPAPGYRNDVKQYSVTVAIDGENREGMLRPGMSATIEIDVGTLKDVLAVPLPAIDRVGDEHYVWRATQRGPAPARVTLGTNNLSHVEVLRGIAEGDRVYLTRPAGVEPPKPAEDVGGAPGAGREPAGDDVTDS